MDSILPVPLRSMLFRPQCIRLSLHSGWDRRGRNTDLSQRSAVTLCVECQLESTPGMLQGCNIVIHHAKCHTGSYLSFVLTTFVTLLSGTSLDPSPDRHSNENPPPTAMLVQHIVSGSIERGIHRVQIEIHAMFEKPT